MQATSDLYKSIIAGSHHWETVVSIGYAPDVLGKDTAESVTFGGLEILLDDGGINTGYGDDTLYSVKTSAAAFSGNAPEVGGCIAKSINVEIMGSIGNVPRAARMILWVRCTDGERHSEWIQKGIYYIDTRATRKSVYGDISTTITGYDAVLKFESKYPDSSIDWPARDIDAINEICSIYGIGINPETAQIINGSNTVQYPGEYTVREFLGFIAGMYAGSFVLDDCGRLRLVQL